MDQNDDYGDDIDQETIGYGRPPRSGQFRPGRSGNPRGRPKGSKGLATIVREQSAKRIVATTDGKRISMSVSEAIVMRIMREGLSGKRDAMKQSLSLIERHVLQAEPVEDDDERCLEDLTLWELSQLSRLSYKANGSMDGYWESYEASVLSSFESFLAHRCLRPHGETFAEYYLEQQIERIEEQKRCDIAEDTVRAEIFRRVTGEEYPGESIRQHPVGGSAE